MEGEGRLSSGPGRKPVLFPWEEDALPCENRAYLRVKLKTRMNVRLTDTRSGGNQAGEEGGWGNGTIAGCAANRKPIRSPPRVLASAGVLTSAN